MMMTKRKQGVQNIDSLRKAKKAIHTRLYRIEKELEDRAASVTHIVDTVSGLIGTVRQGLSFLPLGISIGKMIGRMFNKKKCGK